MSPPLLFQILEGFQPIDDELSHQVVVQAVNNALVGCVRLHQRALDELLRLGVVWLRLLARCESKPVAELQTLVPIHPGPLKLVTGEL